MRTGVAFAPLLAAALGAAACGGLPGRPAPGEAEIRPDRVTDFQTLYSENCAGCHGPRGGGGAGAIGLANPIYLAIADDEVIRRTTASGAPGTLMPAFAQSSGGMLTDPQIGILVKGIRGWARAETSGSETPPPHADAAGDAARGADVYARFCASCHGPDGAGGPKAGSIVDGSFLGLVSDQSLRTTIIAGRPDIGQPDWRSDVAGQPLSARDVSDVVAWLSARRPSLPGQPYPGRNP